MITAINAANGIRVPDAFDMVVFAPVVLTESTNEAIRNGRKIGAIPRVAFVAMMQPARSGAVVADILTRRENEFTERVNRVVPYQGPY